MSVVLMADTFKMKTIHTKDRSGAPCAYVPSKFLGAGGFGMVVLGVREKDPGSDGRPVAVKKLSYTVTTPEERSQLYDALKEKWAHLDQLRHDNLVEYLSSELKPPVESLNKVAGIVVMEYCSLGSLSGFLKDHPLSWAEIHDAAKQILDGLSYLHDKRIVHGDMKTCNVLLERSTAKPFQKQYKIADLDDYVLLSNATSSLLASQRENLRSTLQFKSPELLKNIPGTKIGRKTDIWSFGCIIIDMLRLERPFRFIQTPDGRELPSDILCFTAEIRSHALMNFVADGGCPEVPYDTPSMVAKFLRKCFKHSPKRRHAATELLVLDWMKLGSLIQGFPVHVEDLPGSRSDYTLTTPGIVEFKLKNQKTKEGHYKLPRPARDMKWDLGLICGARLMLHHGEAFPHQLYQPEAQEAPRIIEPGKRIPENIRKVMVKTFEGTRNLFNPLNWLFRFAVRLILGSNNNFSKLVSTLMLTSLGPIFPDVCVWMNRYTRTSENEYVYKPNATWDDIKARLDNKDPVMVQYSPKTQSFVSVRPESPSHRLNAMLGIAYVLPKTFPEIWAAIIWGYREVDGKVAEIYLADPNGDDGSLSYDDFEKFWATMPDHEVVKELFACMRYQPNSMIYRQKKHGY